MTEWGTDVKEGREGDEGIEEMCAEAILENTNLGGKMEGSVVNVNSGGRKEGSTIAEMPQVQVLQEIQNITYDDGVSTNVAMKENINPTMKPSRGNSGRVEPKGGKRKGMEEGSDTLIDVGASALKKAKSVEVMGKTIDISSGRTVLTSGMRRSIGDDKSTRVWEDPWVVFDRPTTLTATNQYAEEVEKVCDLLNESGDSWNEEKFRRAQGGDKWVWEVDRSGSYTVKSGYRHAMIDTWKQFETGLDIDADATSKFWRRLWKLQLL
ncbi:uncharacterized protein G2W53_007238 [Senna tora]|uniref:Uncharacterized protein n=1 Tax=Senna tora TaxID=362788 RepID=A0A835CER6_9FABA|nr:uncharacterized protein G2W53_007238 [Senna tora]